MKLRLLVVGALATCCSVAGLGLSKLSRYEEQIAPSRKQSPNIIIPETGPIQPVYVRRSLELADIGWRTKIRTELEIVRATGFYAMVNDALRFITVKHIYSATEHQAGEVIYRAGDTKHDIRKLDFDIRVSTVPFVAWRDTVHPTQDISVLKVDLDEQTQAQQEFLELDTSSQVHVGQRLQVRGWPDPVAISTKEVSVVRSVNDFEFLIEPGLEDGFSGSPMMINGKVVGIVIGRTVKGFHSHMLRISSFRDFDDE